MTESIFGTLKTNLKCSIICIFLLSTNLNAQEKKDHDRSFQGSLGLSLGSDIGGAVPVPVSNIPGTINAYPHVGPSLGVSVSFPFAEKWGCGADINYKTVAMKADARVNNQRFNMDDATMYFSGTAQTDMKFIMLEVPMYTKYRFRSRNAVFTGLYYSYILSSNFIADPLKGYAGSTPGIAEITDVSDITMDFSEYMTNWDLGFLAGYERTILDKLRLSMRFSIGFKNVFKSSNKYFDYSMVHMRGCISLTYDMVKLKIKDRRFMLREE
ncbi:MAG: PorT family protein [Prevotellaceae bacterium]|jgi:hypothetical protein|nr:PorT family protein [Prevotellaceae bacterium]